MSEFIPSRNVLKSYWEKSWLKTKQNKNKNEIKAGISVWGTVNKANAGVSFHYGSQQGTHWRRKGSFFSLWWTELTTIAVLWSLWRACGPARRKRGTITAITCSPEAMQECSGKWNISKAPYLWIEDFGASFKSPWIRIGKKFFHSFITFILL